MRHRNLTAAVLLAVILAAGCGEQHEAGPRPAGPQYPGENAPAALPGPTAEHRIETDTVAEPNGPLSLRTALALTLVNNPALKVFSLETRAAQARELQAGLWPNPELEVEVEEAGGTGERSGFDAAETTIQLSQLVELGDKSRKRRKVASFERELAGMDYQGKKLEVFGLASQAFVAVLEAQEKLRLSGEMLKLSEESFGAVEKRVGAGKDSPLEKTRASVALSNIRIKHRARRRDLEFARKRLASFWAQESPLFERAAGNLDDIRELPPSDQLVRLLEQNPQYARWEAEIRKSEAVLELEKSGALGDVTIGAGLQRFNETDDNAVVFGASIPLPISDRNQGSTEAAVYNLAKSKQKQKEAWLGLLNEFNLAYRDLVDSYSRASSLAGEVLAGASEVFSAAATAYREGKVDYLNVLDAQRTFFEVRNEYIESLASYHTAKANVERLIGQRIDETETNERIKGSKP
jgi:cobalt-zinc-cadmium efflux system outer membrane protein